MFDKIWFRKYQKQLLWLLNTPFIRIYFRWIFRINGKSSSVGNKTIIGISPNAIAWKGKKKNQYVSEFRTHDKFTKRLYYAFLPLWYVIHYWDILFANNFAPRYNLGFDSTGDLFPAAGANSPCDGTVYRNGTADEVFGTIRAGAGTVASVTDVSMSSPQLRSNATTDHYSLLARGIICWDASVIPDTATIDSATISLYSAGKANGLGSPALHASGATPAATNDLQASDYGQLQTVSFGNITYANYADTSYNDIVLDANGLANISKTGVSKFGFQTSWDILNSFTGTWASATQSHFGITLADTAGTTQDPKLVVLYTPLASSAVDTSAYFM